MEQTIDEQDSLKQGVYLCQGCGKFFKVEVNLAVSCTLCGTHQLSVNVWNSVIRKRDHGLSFSGNIEVAEPKEIPAEDRAIDHKLDIIGRKKAKARFLAIFISLCWLGGIGYLGYKARTASQNVTPTEQFGDGSLSSDGLLDLKAVASDCFDEMKQFVQSRTIVEREKLVYNPDTYALDRYYGRSGVDHFPVLIKALHATEHETHTEMLFLATLTPSSKKFESMEANFVKDGDNWRLDWEHYVNHGTMSMTEFVETKPQEKQTFRVYYTKLVAGTSIKIFLIEAQPNNYLFDRQDAERVVILVDTNHPMREKLEMAMEANEDFAAFNGQLADKDISGHRSSDPVGHYRITVSMHWEEDKDGYKQVVLDEVLAAHWLGSYYKEFLNPTQLKLTRD